MKCATPGCYAKPYLRNLCRSHYQLWREMLPTRTPLRRADRKRYVGPCRCEHPQPERIPMFDCWQCRQCGMPLVLEGVNDGRTAS